MSFQEALKTLKESSEFKSFIKKNKKSFLFSAFFVLGPNFEVETQQIDYFISDNKAATFYLTDPIQLKIGDFNPTAKVMPLNEKIKIDVDSLKDIVLKEIQKQKLGNNFANKVLAIMQNQDQKQIWNLTCLSSSFKILRMHVDCFSGKILKSEQHNMLDFIRIQKGNKQSQEQKQK
jgi:hypothetical protein